MTEFKSIPVVYSTTDGRRCANKELAEEIQFWLDFERWIRENPIEPEAEIPPNASRIASWVYNYRKTISMAISKMQNSRPILE